MVNLTLQHRQSLPNWVHKALTDPSPPWLIDQMIPAGALTIIAGRPKLSKKSWLAMLMGMVMSSGTESAGLRPTARIPVLYISLEGAPFSTAERFKMLEAGHKIPLTTCSDMFFSLNEGFFLDEDKMVTELCRFIVDKSIQCVIIDTFAKAFTGDENSSRDVGAAMRGVTKILSAGCAVVLVHHLRKVQHSAGKSGEDMFDPDSGLRGSSALAGAMDQIISIKNVPNQNGNGYDTVYVVGGKAKEYVGREVDWTIDGIVARLEMSDEKPLDVIADEHSPADKLSFK
jgi:RecA-family ATPase